MPFRASMDWLVRERSTWSAIFFEYSFSTIGFGALPGRNPETLALRTNSSVIFCVSDATCAASKDTAIFFLVSLMFSIFVFIILKLS